jgi:glycogen synthase
MLFTAFTERLTVQDSSNEFLEERLPWQNADCMISAPDATLTLPRRILMTADTIGGVWTFALELARGLTPYGIEVVLATMGELPGADQRREASRIENLTLCESSFRLEWMEDPWEDVRRAGAWLLSLEARLMPDQVHLNGYAHAALPWQAPCLITAHSCVLSWWAMVQQTELPDRFLRYRQEVSRGLAAADMVAVPTSAMLQALQFHYLALPRVRVIPNARCTDLFHPAAKEAYIFSVGRIWDEAKNLAAVAQAAPFLPWPVFVAGEQDQHGSGSVQLENISFLGRLPARQLAGWFERGSVYALPARYEPFGLSVLEAAICRCALVLGDIESLRELWDGAAVFVPPDDSLALIAALQQLCSNHSHRAALAFQAHRRSSRFNPTLMAAQYLEAYTAAAAHHHQAPEAAGDFGGTS